MYEQDEAESKNVKKYCFSSSITTITTAEEEEDVDDFSRDHSENCDYSSIDGIRRCQKLETINMFMLIDKNRSLYPIIKPPKSVVQERNWKIPQIICSFHSKNVQVGNIVFISSIGCNINLRLAACYLNNCDYDPKTYFINLRTKLADVVCRVSATGTLTIFNCKSEHHMRNIVRMFANKLKKAALENSSILDISCMKIKKPRICSIKSDFRLNFRLQSLEAFVKQYELSENDTTSIIYDPEMSPFLSIKNNKNVKIQVASSGAITFLGAKKIDDIKESVEYWFPKFEHHRKENDGKISSSPLTSRKPVAPMSQAVFETIMKENLTTSENLQDYFPMGLAQLLSRSLTEYFF